MGSSQEPSSPRERMATNSGRTTEGATMAGGAHRASPGLLLSAGHHQGAPANMTHTDLACTIWRTSVDTWGTRDSGSPFEAGDKGH